MAGVLARNAHRSGLHQTETVSTPNTLPSQSSCLALIGLLRTIRYRGRNAPI